MNLKKITIWAIILYASLIAFLFFFQRNLQYAPMGQIKPIVDYNLEGFKEEKITTADKIKILAWYRAPKKDEKIILFFHGNAGNLGDRSEKLNEFSKHNSGVLAISYRGYFGSEGVATQAGLITDVEAAFKFLLDRGYTPQDIILYGESLGSGVATQLAAKFDFFAVILESPFSSVVGVAQRKYWFAPVGLLLKDKFDSGNIADKISAPVLIFHGTNDKIVPFAEGKKLFDAIKSQKKFIEMQGAGHLGFDDEFLVGEEREFLREMKGEKE